MTTSASAPPLKVSAYAPFAPATTVEVAWWAAMVHSMGLDRLWFGQPATVDVAQGIAFAAGRGHRCPVGSGVTLTPTRHVMQTALELRGLVSTTGHRVVACFSPGDPVVQKAFTGAAYRSPFTATTEFLTALRGLLSGKPTTVDGTYVTVDARQPGPDVTDDVEIGLGVLRPRMAELAGALADSLITWLATPAYLHEVLLPAVDAGAATADRPRPRTVTTLHAVLAADDADPLHLAHRAVGTHLRAPHYQDLLTRCGIPVRDGGASALRAVLDHGVVTYGPPEDVAARAAALRRAGADEVAVVLHHPEGASRERAVEDWSAIRDACAGLRAGGAA